MSAISKIIETPLGAVLMLVITLVLASLTVASAISGALTAEMERNPLSLPNRSFRNSEGKTFELDICWFVCHSPHYLNDKPFK